MKRHEKLAIEIREQRDRVSALQREQREGLDKQIADLVAERSRIDERIHTLSIRRDVLPVAIADAQMRLDELLMTRRVEETPDLKKLSAAAEKFKKLCEQAGVDPQNINDLLQ